jgi:hypothetical protein
MLIGSPVITGWKFVGENEVDFEDDVVFVQLLSKRGDMR